MKEKDRKKILRHIYDEDFRKIKKILQEWDPIGSGNPDEYDNYIPLLVKNKDNLTQITNTLENMLLHEIGLSYDPSNPVHKKDVEEIARRIYALFRENWENIYVELIEGVETLLPVKARKLRQAENEDYAVYEIMENREFDPEDYTSVWEFLPGDTVLVKENYDKNGPYLRAVERISAKHPDRSFYQFLYDLVKQSGRLTPEQEKFYRNEWEHLEKLISTHKEFHPQVLKALKHFRNNE